MKKYRFHLLNLTEHVRKKKILNFSTIERARPKTHTYFFGIHIAVRAVNEKLVKHVPVVSRLMSLEDTPLKLIYLYVDFARLSNHFIFQIH